MALQVVVESCGARRMAETAAHLVDYVIPRVRQWVLSFPIPLRILFAAHPDLLFLANSQITQPRASDIAPDNAISTRSSRVARAVVMVHRLPPSAVYHQMMSALELRCSSP